MQNVSVFTSRAKAEAFAKSKLGGMTQTSKMPSYSWSTSAFACKVGSKLACIPGSVCRNCYARKNRYLFAQNQTALAKRLQILEDSIPCWRDNMVTFLRGVLPFVAPADRFFRWHDSGDIQSIEHLQAVADIARAVPEWRFWLPTKEYATVRAWRKQGNVAPENLVIRVSHPMRNARGSALNLGPGSGVVDEDRTETARAAGYVCPAPEQQHKCMDCRACWTATVTDVFYVNH